MTSQSTVNVPAELRVEAGRFDVEQSEKLWQALHARVPVIILEPGTPEFSLTDTYATDGTRMIVNRTFAERINREETGFTIRHENVHIEARHPLRAREIKRVLTEELNIEYTPDIHFLVNVAADIETNEFLQRMGYPVPSNCIQPEARFKGQVFESIFWTLYGEREEGGKGVSGSPGGTPDPGGILIPADDETAALAESIAERIEVDQAILGGTSAGSGGARSRSTLAPVDDASDWRHILREFTARATGAIVKYDSQRPSKRTYALGLDRKRIYLPRRKREGMGELVYVLDVSGSCYGYVRNRMSGVLTRITEQAKPAKIHVLYFSYRTVDEAVFSPAGFREAFAAKDPDTDGGTDLEPALARVQELCGARPIGGVLIFTDGYYSRPEAHLKPPVPTLVFVPKSNVAHTQRNTGHIGRIVGVPELNGI